MRARKTMIKTIAVAEMRGNSGIFLKHNKVYVGKEEQDKFVNFVKEHIGEIIHCIYVTDEGLLELQEGLNKLIELDKKEEEKTTTKALKVR